MNHDLVRDICNTYRMLLGALTASVSESLDLQKQPVCFDGLLAPLPDQSDEVSGDEGLFLISGE